MLKKIFVLFLFILVSINTSVAQAKVIKDLVHHAGGDIKNTFAWWPGLIIAGGAIAAGSLVAFDNDLDGGFNSGRHLGKVDSVAKFMGQPYVLDPLALAVFGVGKIVHNEDMAFTGENLFEALLFTDALTGGLKLAFRRERPNGGNYSFPSGHAAGTFAMATVLETLHGPWVGIPAYAVASLISFSRIDSHDHHVSDVVFGAALGSAIGWGTAHFHKHENQHLFFVPSVGQTSGLTMVYKY
ncbi:MAG: Phosphoesterase PA-phosphatase related protein [uncultured bacterium]|nr:MAG: Phosphoesterase PA-phosphatase related protein [uncultured bacterium]